MRTAETSSWRHRASARSPCGGARVTFFSDTQRGLRMVTDLLGTVVDVTDSGDTAPLPPPSTPPTWRPHTGAFAAPPPPPDARPSQGRSRGMAFASGVV